MKRGGVYYVDDLEFLDGGHANKLIILLSDPSEHEEALFVLATSQAKRGRTTDRGCQFKKQEFFIPGGKEFPQDTWIQLGRIPFVYKTSDIKSLIGKGSWVLKTSLSEQRTNEIRNCMERCNENISRYHCEILGIKFKP